MNILPSVILALSLSNLVACKGKDAGATGDQPATKPAAAAAKPEWKKIASLGLEAEVPGDAMAKDSTADAGFPMGSFVMSPTVFIQGAGDMSDLKPTLDETKAQLAKDPNKLKSWTKSETTSDGWILEGTRESMTGDTLYAISIRRTLNGKPFDCGTNASSEIERDAAKKVCTSLRAAK